MVFSIQVIGGLGEMSLAGLTWNVRVHGIVLRLACAWVPPGHIPVPENRLACL